MPSTWGTKPWRIWSWWSTQWCWGNPTAVHDEGLNHDPTPEVKHAKGWKRLKKGGFFFWKYHFEVLWLDFDRFCGCKTPTKALVALDGWAETHRSVKLYPPATSSLHKGWKHLCLQRLIPKSSLADEHAVYVRGGTSVWPSKLMQFCSWSLLCLSTLKDTDGLQWT